MKVELCNNISAIHYVCGDLLKLTHNYIWEKVKINIEFLGDSDDIWDGAYMWQYFLPW